MKTKTQFYLNVEGGNTVKRVTIKGHETPIIQHYLMCEHRWVPSGYEMDEVFKYLKRITRTEARRRIKEFRLGRRF